MNRDDIDGTMANSTDPALAAALAALDVPGILVGHRLIAPGDERALVDAEARAIVSARLDVRRASGAARIVGRALMARLGVPPGAVPKGEGGAPQWPAGLVGSFAHDARAAVAALARTHDIAVLGIDVEAAAPLPGELHDLVATPAECAPLAGDPLGLTRLFVAKEAVYKAAFPRDRRFLEFHDIAVDLAAQRAVAGGRTYEVRLAAASHVVALAFVRAATDRTG